MIEGLPSSAQLGVAREHGLAVIGVVLVGAEDPLSIVGRDVPDRHLPIPAAVDGVAAPRPHKSDHVLVASDHFPDLKARVRRDLKSRAERLTESVQTLRVPQPTLR